jgi:hypothetical protein
MNGHVLMLVGAVMVGVGVGVLNAQQRPAGEASLNQAISARVVTKSDATVLTPTRGLYVGDAAACTLALVFQADNVTGAGATITFTNVQPGTLLPFQVAKVMAATTCTAVTALY